MAYISGSQTVYLDLPVDRGRYLIFIQIYMPSQYDQNIYIYI